MAEEHLRKAAILLLSLPDEQVAELLAKLTPKQAEMVSAEIARLGQLSGAEQQAVIHEFAAANASSTEENNLDEAGRPLPFSDLKKVDPQDLIVVIQGEHPQTIALILSHLPPAHAGRIIQGLPAEFAVAVIRRVADLAPTSPEVIQVVERVLAGRIANLPNQTPRTAGGASTVAEILSAADRTTERGLLESLARADPALVEEIRWHVFASEGARKAA